MATPSVHKSASTASVSNMSTPSAVPSNAQPATTDVRVSPIADAVPAESIQLFKKECIEVLSPLPGQRVQLAKFPEAYYKAKGQIFSLARYKAKKIVLLAQEIPDTVRVSVNVANVYNIYKYCFGIPLPQQALVV